MEEPDQGSPGQRFGRSLRLRASRDFQRIQKNGERRRSRHLVLVWLPSERELPRFGLAVSKKVGNAVIRNRVKRWLREAIRRQRGSLAHVDAVFIARDGAAEAGYESLRAEVATLLDGLRRAGRA